MQTADSHDFAGLTLSHLEELCQPERLERTVCLLFYLNHWAKEREQLFFADRQGLYEVKAVLLHYLYVTGAIEAVAYIDGIQGFGKEIDIAIAADLAAEGVVERLEGLSDPDPCIWQILMGCLIRWPISFISVWWGKKYRLPRMAKYLIECRYGNISSSNCRNWSSKRVPHGNQFLVMNSKHCVLLQPICSLSRIAVIITLNVGIAGMNWMIAISGSLIPKD